MQRLHRVFNAALRKRTRPAVLLETLLTRKLRDAGVKIDPKVRATVRRASKAMLASEGDASTISIEVPDAPPSIEISPRDVQDLLSDLGKSVEDSIPKFADGLARILRREIANATEQELSNYRDARSTFEARLHTTFWAKAFDSFALLVGLATDRGSELSDWLRSGRRAKEQSLVEALTRLHGRACQTAGEVLALLESGYADGAMARWRTLHEINVVICFLREHGEPLAERYLLHQDIDSLRTARQHNSLAAATGARPLSQRFVDQLGRIAMRRSKQFGGEFLNEYGWAAKVLRKAQPTFRDIEAAVGQAFARTSYKLASNDVHAGPKGAMFKLGLIAGVDSIILAGPSNVGLHEPGRLAAHSLAQATVEVLLLRPTLDTIVWSKVLMRLAADVAREFERAQRHLLREAKRLKQIPSQEKA